MAMNFLEVVLKEEEDPLDMKECGGLSDESSNSSCGSRGQGVSDNSSTSLSNIKKSKQVKRFTCSSCEYATCYKTDLKRHLLVHTGEKPYKCCVCQASFSTASYLKNHKLSLHEGKKRFKCFFCDYATFYKSNLNKHQLVHSDFGENPNKSGECGISLSQSTLLEGHEISTQEREKNFKCSFCDYTTFNEAYLKTHLLVHQEKPFKCEECQGTFSTFRKLKSHILSTHGGKKLFKCSFCDYNTFWKGDFKKHEFVHNGKKPFKCDQCEAAFSRASRLKKHKLAIHEKEKKFKCLLCDYAAFQKISLETHLLIHSEETPFTCAECGASFSKKNQLKGHKLSVHQGVKRFQCSFCDYATFYNRNFKSHVLIHCGIKPYTCEECGLTFSQTSHLKSHKLSIHDGEKSFKCTLCNYASFYKSNLKTHQLVHSREKRFKCEECGNIYTHISSMKKHQRLVHRGGNTIM